VIVVASALYGLGMWKVRRKGETWSGWVALGFYGLGLGSYAVIELGFLGVYSSDLRWAFTTRVALLIFVVPALIAVGRPLELLQRALDDPGKARIARMLEWRIIRLFGNAVFATIFVASVFLIFLTPISWVLRGTPWISAVLGILVPLLGLLMVLPLAALSAAHTGLFITIEFLLAFVELLIDSIPGILLRLSGSVLDHAPTITGATAWWPSALRDQQLAGDWLWFIAEAVDVPVLVILMVRWMRSDKREAKTYDDLTDEEYEAMTQAHLRGER
jgi:putative membrane protein